MDDPGHAPSQPSGGAHRMAPFLSLYLLLLAFFILLNSISTIETVRARALFDSLASTFSTVLPGPDADPFASQIGDVVAARALRDRLASVFQTAIPAVRVHIIQPGGPLQLSMHVEAMFMPDRTELRPGRSELLGRLAGVLAAPPPGLRYEIEARVGVPDAVPLPAGQTLMTARLGVLARALVAAGAPAGAVGVGLERGDAARLHLLFRVLADDQGRARQGAAAAP